MSTARCVVCVPLVIPAVTAATHPCARYSLIDTGGGYAMFTTANARSVTLAFESCVALCSPPQRSVRSAMHHARACAQRRVWQDDIHQYTVHAIIHQTSIWYVMAWWNGVCGVGRVGKVVWWSGGGMAVGGQAVVVTGPAERQQRVSCPCAKPSPMVHIECPEWNARGTRPCDVMFCVRFRAKCKRQPPMGVSMIAWCVCRRVAKR